MPLYRIAYVSASAGHSVVLRLPAQPALGDRLAVDEHTVVRVREVVPHGAGDTIAAEVLAEVSDASEGRQ